MFPKVSSLYFHHSGYATINSHSPSRAGWWKVGANETMRIEELIKLFSLHAARQKQVKLSVYADTPGASGVFHRLIQQLNQAHLTIHPNFK